MPCVRGMKWTFFFHLVQVSQECVHYYAVCSCSYDVWINIKTRKEVWTRGSPVTSPSPPGVSFLLPEAVCTVACWLLSSSLAPAHLQTPKRETTELTVPVFNRSSRSYNVQSQNKNLFILLLEIFIESKWERKERQEKSEEEGMCMHVCARRQGVGLDYEVPSNEGST